MGVAYLRHWRVQRRLAPAPAPAPAPTPPPTARGLPVSRHEALPPRLLPRLPRLLPVEAIVPPPFRAPGLALRLAGLDACHTDTPPHRNEHARFNCVNAGCRSSQSRLLSAAALCSSCPLWFYFFHSPAGARARAGVRLACVVLGGSRMAGTIGVTATGPGVSSRSCVSASRWALSAFWAAFLAAFLAPAYQP